MLRFGFGGCRTSASNDSKRPRNEGQRTADRVLGVMAALLLVAPALFIGGCGRSGSAAPDPASAELSRFDVELAEWRSDREASLLAPDGWLNLAGLYWLRPGVNTFGADRENDLVVRGGQPPPRLGEFLVDADAVTFRAEPQVEVLQAGEPVTELLLADDSDNDPAVLTHGTLVWTVIRRLDRVGVRLRDLDHPSLATFEGLDWYPGDPAWAATARFEPYDERRSIRVPTVVDGLGWEPAVPGTLEFRVGDEDLSLEVYESSDNEGLFIVFADATTGETTYPGGRYLDAELPGTDGTTVLDFNRAYSPPCVFTEFATCPLATSRNRLSIAVEAGERYEIRP